jgi:hypothetical protein
MKSKNLNVFFFSVILFCGCERDNVGFQNEQFVGKWIIVEVIKDDVQQSSWGNVTIEIAQSDESNGTYTTNSPNDLIWKREGNWHKTENPNAFSRDDGIDITYAVTDQTLQFGFLILEEFPCGTPCILPLAGQWRFKLKSI